MSRRSVITLITVVLGITIGVLWSRRDGEPPAASATSSRRPAAAPTSSIASSVAGPALPVPTPARPTPATATPETPPEQRSTLADGLNAPDGNIQRDFRIIEDVLIAWRSNYPQYGNPVGENNEITDLLTGNNSLHLALIPKDHPAVNADGELCDRWGTPFRFHQLSGDRMEIRSAGPDRKFGSADDAKFTP
jgi:hypothetical protein